MKLTAPELYRLYSAMATTPAPEYVGQTVYLCVDKSEDINRAKYTGDKISDVYRRIQIISQNFVEDGVEQLKWVIDVQ